MNSATLTSVVVKFFLLLIFILWKKDRHIEAQLTFCANSKFKIFERKKMIRIKKRKFSKRLSHQLSPSPIGSVQKFYAFCTSNDENVRRKNFLPNYLGKGQERILFSSYRRPYEHLNKKNRILFIKAVIILDPIRIE